MDNQELNKYRINFYKRLEEYMEGKSSLTASQYDKIVSDNIKETNIDHSTSNKIMVFMGAYKSEKSKHSTREYLTYEDNISAKYKLYMDIETGEIYKVCLENVKNFENEYKVIYPKVDICNIQVYNNEYKNLRREYFKSLLYTDQEEATLKLINK